MLGEAFQRISTKFKLHFYRTAFGCLQDRGTDLTPMETFSMEIIMALGKPTINEFSKFLRISAPNAAYKISSLIQKGYVRKVRSTRDKREYYLEITQKYIDHHNVWYNYLSTVVERIQARFSDEDSAYLEKMLNIITDELMPEIALPPEA